MHPKVLQWIHISHTFFADSWQGECSIGDSAFSCLTLTAGGGDDETGDITGSGKPWQLKRLLIGRSFGTGDVSAHVPWELSLLFSTGWSCGIAGGSTGSDVLEGELASAIIRQ